MKRQPRQLVLETLGSRELLTSLIGDSGGAETTVTDDVVIDGNIITAENYDSEEQRGIIINNTPTDEEERGIIIINNTPTDEVITATDDVFQSYPSRT